FALARLLPNGTLDSSFGPNGNGLVTTNFGTAANPTNDEATVILVQPDGKIVLVGKSGTRIAMARYLAVPPDSDGDGVHDVIEDGVNSQKDGNHDNIPDSQQDYVASLPNAVTHTYLTLVNAPRLDAPSGGRPLQQVTALAPTPPAHATLPVGAISFTARAG